jgi:hypothetical protein
MGPVLLSVAEVLSGCAKGMGWSERRSVGGMEMDFEPGEEDFGGLLEAGELVPPAMAGELVFKTSATAAQ